MTRTAVLTREFLIFCLASDASEFSVTFPFAGAWSVDWPHEVRAELRRGSYDPDWDPPHYAVTLAIDSSVEEAESYPEHIVEEFAEINGWLAHDVPIRLETLLRLWRARPVWVLMALPDRDESELRKLRQSPRSFEMHTSEIASFTAFASKLSPLLDQVAALEWDLLKADARAVTTKRPNYDYRSSLDQKALTRLERHLAHSLALRWYDLCFRREATLRVEQTVVAAMIVLETLFGDERDGAKWEIRARAARLLGRDAGEVTRLRTALDEYYGRRNAIVHAGTERGRGRGRPSTRSTIPVLDVIRRAILTHLTASAGAELNRAAVIRMLDEGRAPELRLAAERFLGSAVSTPEVFGGESAPAGQR
jgi:hypothetical protein